MDRKFGRLEALGQGLTAGFGDELGAGLQEVFAALSEGRDYKPGATYRQARGENRGLYADQARVEPKTTLALEAAGALPTLALPMGKLGVMGGGALVGGLSAAGSNNGSIGERLLAGVDGAAIGAAGGKALQTAGRAAAPLVERAVEAVAPKVAPVLERIGGRVIPSELHELARRLMHSAKLQGQDALDAAQAAALRGGDDVANAAVRAKRALPPQQNQDDMVRAAGDMMDEQTRRLEMGRATWKGPNQGPVHPESGLPVITPATPTPISAGRAVGSEAMTNPGAKAPRDLLEELLDPTLLSKRRQGGSGT